MKVRNGSYRRVYIPGVDRKQLWDLEIKWDRDNFERGEDFVRVSSHIDSEDTTPDWSEFVLRGGSRLYLAQRTVNTGDGNFWRGNHTKERVLQLEAFLNRVCVVQDALNSSFYTCECGRQYTVACQQRW